MISIVLLISINSCKKDESTSKRDPVITWANPADIGFGVFLSPTQLNATADVPGTFVYTPAIGTKLNIGANQVLKVDFTPTDATDYNTASKTVVINVIASTTGTVTDADGNVYHTVTIGTQTWMIENLRTTKYNDGSAIPNITDAAAWMALSTPAYCFYDNDVVTKKAIYGALYNWFTINTGKLCPKGWHVPNDAEWTTLENYLIVNGYNYDDTNTGNNCAKALASTMGWHFFAGKGTVGNSDYPAKRNATGFTALPGGYRDFRGSFDYIGLFGFWWSLSEIRSNYAGYRIIYFLSSNLGGNQNYKSFGFSVRCLRD